VWARRGYFPGAHNAADFDFIAFSSRERADRARDHHAGAAELYAKDLVLGLSAREMVLLAMTILISMLTLDNGRTNILFGLVHVVVFAVFLFMAFVP